MGPLEDPEERDGDRPEDRCERRDEGARKRPRTRMNGGCLIAILTLFSTLSYAHSHLPDKYPIEVYHMLQERTQFGIGSENRVKGNWGPWSSWSECSRSCGTGIQSQARECVPARGLRRKRSIYVSGSGNTTSLEKPICIGTYKRYHVCNTQCRSTDSFKECNEFPDDPRAEQCARYNNRIYKGQSYLWVPFLNAPNPCALNCRAVGQRFYATLEPAVVDGTPCDGPNLRGHSTGKTIDKTEQWLCVAGQCRPVGCDGVVGSGATRDTCGICGGVGKSCKLYEGIFMEPILPKGHQPVTTIPRGAMSLNISELRSSPNYLALKTENGSYILNGPWSVSPSGTYKAAGTSITYQRGDRTRMESILATGPLNESLMLEISYHELNPGVLYKYMLPVTEEPDDGAMIAPPLRAIGSNERGNEIPGTDTRFVPVSDPTRPRKRLEILPDKRRNIETTIEKKEDMKYSPTTVMAGDAPKTTGAGKRKKKNGRKKFIWKVMGLSSCSKTCGGGFQTAILKCVRVAKGISVNERRCRNIEKPQVPPPLRCNDRPCPARWNANPWSDCSVTCGTGTKTRKLECVQELNAKLTMRVAAGACVQPPDLRTVESCTKQACPNVSIPEVRSLQTDHETPRWETGPWSSCSTSCGRGTKNRSVTCVSTGKKCSLAEKPDNEKICEVQSCVPKHDSNKNHAWMYSDWSSTCSSKCGNGFVTRQLLCSHTNEIFCDSKLKPQVRRECTNNETSCNVAEWFAGPWSPCTVSCGSGEQVRDIICVKKIGGESRIVPKENCLSSRPETSRTCELPDCRGEWFTSDWSECSASCGEGVKNRLVRCMLEKEAATSCEEDKKPADTQKCNSEACKNKSHHVASRVPKKVPAAGKCVDDFPNCDGVVKTGLCRIKYYKHSCCGCRE